VRILKPRNPFIRYSLWLGAGVLALSIIALWVTTHDTGGSRTKNTELVQDRGASGGNPAGSDAVQFKVPSERVPRTVQDAEQSGAIALTPNRWESDPQATAGTPAVPVTTRDEVIKTADEFLRLWESFAPGNDATGPERSDYRLKLIEFVAPGSLGDIAKRIDSHAPAGICPDQGCATGSQFLGDVVNPTDAAEVRAVDGDSVYLVTSGAVRYDGNSPLSGLSYYRSYGLVMRREGDRWYVTRAAADTSGPVQ
jgi:hypothetical protein